MTNLANLWADGEPSERKNHISRSGAIQWCFLASGRSVHTYNSGRGFVLKIHDDMTHRFRHSNLVTLGTVKKDTLCLDCNGKQIAIGGLVSQRVWVFTIKEGPQTAKSALEAILDAIRRQKWYHNNDNAKPNRVYTEMYKFINAGAGVAKVKLHPSTERIAVLLPTNLTVEVWNLMDVMRLQTFTIPSDSSFLIWQDDLLVTAPTYSGIIQAFDTKNDKTIATMSGNIRRIDALAVFSRLCATGEGRCIKLWNLNTSSQLRTWSATKTFISALYMNDAMIISGSSAGIVKVWDLKSVLAKDGSSVQLLRKINMKGVMHYPIKVIEQINYESLIVVAKYEAKKKKDKIKYVRFCCE